MRIERITTALLAGNFEWLLIRVETDAGVVGIGEAHWGAGVQDAVRRLRSILIGQDPRDVDRLWHLMYNATSGAPWSGTVVAAANGIEVALMDAVGKLYQVPVYQLLGGRYRERIRIYADCHAGRSDGRASRGSGESAGGRDWHESYDPASDYSLDAYRRRVESVLAMGFTALKFDLDLPFLTSDPHQHRLPATEIRRLVSIVEAVREAAGDADIAFDCHGQLTLPDAKQLIVALEPYQLIWLEDPIPPENIDALALVGRAARTPICVGENYYLLEPFERVLRSGSVSILHPDFPRSGGFLEMRRICDLANRWYLPVALHNVGSPVATLAAAHVAAASPNFLALEFHAIDVTWWADLVRGGAADIIQGHLHVPQKPGLGIDLDEEVARRHLKPGHGLFDD
jgi:L-alanine-DL-glutamate epimerase-like enolase superfamily enzyme